MGGNQEEETAAGFLTLAASPVCMKSRSQLVLFMLSSFSLFLQMQQGLDLISGLTQKLITNPVLA
jgi:hypothetical protein